MSLGRHRGAELVQLSERQCPELSGEVHWRVAQRGFSTGYGKLGMADRIISETVDDLYGSCLSFQPLGDGQCLNYRALFEVWKVRTG
jgi:hypothetical protein